MQGRGSNGCDTAQACIPDARSRCQPRRATEKAAETHVKSCIYISAFGSPAQLMTFLEELPASRRPLARACRSLRPRRAPSGPDHHRPKPRSAGRGRLPECCRRRQARAASPSCQGRGRRPRSRLPSCPPLRLPGERGVGAGIRGEREGVPRPEPPTPALLGAGFVLPGGRSRPAPLLLAWPRLPARRFPSLPSLPFPRRRRRVRRRPFRCGWAPSPRAECLRAAGCSAPLGSFP